MQASSIGALENNSWFSKEFLPSVLSTATTTTTRTEQVLSSDEGTLTRPSSPCVHIVFPTHRTVERSSKVGMEMICLREEHWQDNLIPRDLLYDVRSANSARSSVLLHSKLLLRRIERVDRVGDDRSSSSSSTTTSCTSTGNNSNISGNVQPSVSNASSLSSLPLSLSSLPGQTNAKSESGWCYVGSHNLSAVSFRSDHVSMPLRGSFTVSLECLGSSGEAGSLVSHGQLRAGRSIYIPGAGAGAEADLTIACLGSTFDDILTNGVDSCCSLCNPSSTLWQI